MLKAIGKVSALGVLLVSSGAGAQSTSTGDFRLQVSVPVICKVSHHAAISATAGGYVLGDLQEYCNAPRGFNLAVDYAPGSMRGAVVSVGDERVVLDGSGHNVISRAPGPRIREREIFSAPGPQGFDTDHLEFSVEAN